jgi:Fe-S cluster assembly protein SufD
VLRLHGESVDDLVYGRLVLHGFFHDLIRKVGVPSIEERLTATVEAELAKNVLKELA